MRLTNWSGLTNDNELTNGGIRMENFVGSIDCSNLYTAMKELSNTCKTIARPSINKVSCNFVDTLKRSLPIIDTSKSLVSNLPYYKVICS